MRKLYLFAGTNGVGKSTLYLDGVGPSIENSVRINADEIAREKDGIGEIRRQMLRLYC